MTAFRAYLVVVLACLAGYAVIVGSHHGWNILPLFFAEIARMAWPGQFDFDFMTFLSLAGIWVAWRHQFSAVGIGLGIVTFFWGMMFFAAYLLWASIQSADPRALLLGKGRAY